MSQRVDVSPELLTWAVNRAGFGLPEFAEKFPPILDWMAGKKPTLIQLEKFAKKVHVPFGYLLLHTPPVEELPIPFFRTGKSNAKSVSINVYDSILMLQQRQEWLRDYLVDNEFDKLEFVGRFTSKASFKEIVRDIRTTLGISEDWADGHRTWEDALSDLRDRIEDQRIIVVVNGVVGNDTRRPIPVDECRGFVLVDDMAPFLFVNNTDSKSAQMFTLAHELAHIWVGQSAGFDIGKMLPADDPVELLCDTVAAEFLVPEQRFRQLWAGASSIQTIARRFKVSEIVVARRALDLGKLTRTEFFDFYNEYSSREHREHKQSGGQFYSSAKYRLSLAFAAHINQAVKSGQLLYRDAYRLTRLSGPTYERFIATYF